MLKDELRDIIQKANIHSVRLAAAIAKVKTYGLSQPLSIEQVAYTDMLTQRFSNLQDTIGARIFPRNLRLIQEDALTFLDKLHRLEKMPFLPKGPDWWIRLRELRNQPTQDYPLEKETTDATLKILLVRWEELQVYWSELKTILDGVVLGGGG